MNREHKITSKAHKQKQNKSAQSTKAFRKLINLCMRPRATPSIFHSHPYRTSPKEFTEIQSRTVSMSCLRSGWCGHHPLNYCGRLARFWSRDYVTYYRNIPRIIFVDPLDTTGELLLELSLEYLSLLYYCDDLHFLHEKCNRLPLPQSSGSQ